MTVAALPESTVEEIAQVVSNCISQEKEPAMCDACYAALEKNLLEMGRGNTVEDYACITKILTHYPATFSGGFLAARALYK